MALMRVWTVDVDMWGCLRRVGRNLCASVVAVEVRILISGEKEPDASIVVPRYLYVYVSGIWISWESGP